MRSIFYSTLLQVKLTVKTPQLGWGKVTHQDVGVLKEVLDDFTLGEDR